MTENSYLSSTKKESNISYLNAEKWMEIYSVEYFIGCPNAFEPYMTFIYII